MQTAIYVRISQDRSGEGLGVGRQLEDCRALAESLGWSVTEVYRDNDISATSTKPRPDYERMLTDIAASRISAIIAWHPDRLYRRMADLEDLITVVEKHDVEIRTVRYGDFDLATPTGRMIARILGSVATGEVEVKSDRWKRAWRQHREAGAPPGGQRLFGYAADGRLVEDEAEVLRWLADRVLVGESLRGLATELNDRGVATAGGNPWNPTRVRRVLLNPRIAGHSTHRGRIVGEGSWEPVLDDTTWQTVRALLEARNRPGSPRVGLLTGLVLCGRCEQPLHSGRTTGGVRRYRCMSGPRLNGCGRLTVVAEPVDDVAEEVAKKLLTRPEVRRWLAQARAGGQEHVLTELDAQQRRLEEIKQTIASGSKNVVLLDQAADIVRERISALESQLAASAPVDVPEDPEVDWPTDLGARRRLLDLVVARVWVDPVEKGGRFDPTRVRVDPTDAVRA